MKAAAIVGGIAAAALIVLGLGDARGALAGWLAGFAFWSSVPLGALLLAMMGALIPGTWRAEIAPPAGALLVLMPLTGLAVLPILAGVQTLYPWARDGGLYLSSGLFVIRSIVLLAILIGLAGLLLLRPSWASRLATGGLILFVLLDTTLAVDWLMSLEPHFHASGFGLYVLAIQANVALPVIVLMRLRLAAARPGLLGALLIVALVIGGYLAFMQYFISWSENLPEPVRWYQHRGAGIWFAAEIAIGLSYVIPLLLLFPTPLRNSRPWLRGIAAAILIGRAIEIAWLVFPATAAGLWVIAAAALLTVVTLTALSVGFFVWIGRATPFRSQRRTR